MKPFRREKLPQHSRILYLIRLMMSSSFAGAACIDIADIRSWLSASTSVAHLSSNTLSNTVVSKQLKSSTCASQGLLAGKHGQSLGCRTALAVVKLTLSTLYWVLHRLSSLSLISMLFTPQEAALLVGVTSSLSSPVASSPLCIDCCHLGSIGEQD